MYTLSLLSDIAIRDQPPEDTPLQVKLNRVVNMITKAGAFVAILLFVVLLIKFFVQLRGSTLSPSQKGNQFIQILIISIVILVIAVPEGLPLAVTLALAYATTRMLKDNNLVRVLKSCETMGNVTTVCSDKTGTLTQNRMTVVAGTLGGTTFDAIQQLPTDLKTLLRQSIAINSTAFPGIENGQKVYIGSKTETALLEMAEKYLGMDDLVAERERVEVILHIPFDSERKYMGVVVDIQGTHRLLVKGASEIILTQCRLAEEERASLQKTIDEYATQSLRTIALAYRDLPHAFNNQDFEMFEDLTWIGVVAIMDPLREGVSDAVRACQNAGVVVRMVTGDNVNTAKAIASKCGIYSGGIVMEGSMFRSLSTEEKAKIIPELQVLARSSPQDKYTLVKCLKQMGETVAVTGDGTNDGPALRSADVGFSMGITGTEVAKEASDIILMDDNFASIVKAILWGRCIGDAVKKFLQVSPRFLC